MCVIAPNGEVDVRPGVHLVRTRRPQASGFLSPLTVVFSTDSEVAIARMNSRRAPASVCLEAVSHASIILWVALPQRVTSFSSVSGMGGEWHVMRTTIPPF